MKKHLTSSLLPAVLTCAAGLPGAGWATPAPRDVRPMAHDIFKELVEIDTTDTGGSTTAAAQAMAQRLLAAGFPAADVAVLGPDERQGNLVVRYRGRPHSPLRPLLIIGHLDVVDARREDWSTDPFQFVERDGFFYGRGTQDMKASDAILVVDFMRLREDGFVPERDLILALTAGEEGGSSNGVDWLLRHHRALIDAEFALNAEATGVLTDRGRPVLVELVATEKLYGDFQVLATNAGGHSSLPIPDNAIYHVARALGVLERTPFPFELNNVTRPYFAELAATESGQTAPDLRAVLATPPDAAAIARLSQDARYNATMRTTCVATTMAAGHAPNALPQRAEANVNCRILPGHSQEEIRLQLVAMFNDPALTVRYRSDAGELLDHGSDRKSMPPPPLRADVSAALREVAGKFWPGAPVTPMMMMWASDSVQTMTAGIPSYGISGVAVERDDIRMHGKDERVGMESYYTGVDFYYEFLKRLTSGGRGAQR